MINMRIPEALLDALKEKAQAKGIPYKRYVGEALEKSVLRYVRVYKSILMRQKLLITLSILNCEF